MAEQSSEGKAFVSAVGQDYACVQNAASFCMLNNLNFTVTRDGGGAGRGHRLPLYGGGDRAGPASGCGSSSTASTACWAPRRPTTACRPRLLEPLEDGPTAGSVPDMALMLREFYALRDLDAEGRLSRTRLEQLGLEALADTCSKSRTSNSKCRRERRHPDPSTRLRRVPAVFLAGMESKEPERARQGRILRLRTAKRPPCSAQDACDWLHLQLLV